MKKSSILSHFLCRFVVRRIPARSLILKENSRINRIENPRCIYRLGATRKDDMREEQCAHDAPKMAVCHGESLPPP